MSPLRRGASPGYSPRHPLPARQPVSVQGAVLPCDVNFAAAGAVRAEKHGEFRHVRINAGSVELVPALSEQAPDSATDDLLSPVGRAEFVHNAIVRRDAHLPWRQCHSMFTGQMHAPDLRADRIAARHAATVSPGMYRRPSLRYRPADPATPEFHRRNQFR